MRDVLDLYEENPEEYVKLALKDNDELKEGFYLLKDNVQEILIDNISPFKPYAQYPLYKFIHAVSDKVPNCTDNKQLIQIMADNFAESPLYKLIYKYIDYWFHEYDYLNNAMQTALCKYFNAIGKCIYDANNHLITYVTDIYISRESRNALSHMELLIRYLNDKLNDEREYEIWCEKLPSIFNYRNYHKFKEMVTGLYYLFMSQMFTLDEQFYTFTPLSRQTKKLLTFCFYNCEWTFFEKCTVPESIGTMLTRQLEMRKMFNTVSDVILREMLYFPVELFSYMKEEYIDMEEYEEFEFMSNDYFILGEREDKSRRLEQLISEYIQLCNPSDLLKYVEYDETLLLSKSLLNALETLIYEEESLAQKSAKMVMKYSYDYSPNLLVEVSLKRWESLLKKAQEIIRV